MSKIVDFVNRAVPTVAGRLDPYKDWETRQVRVERKEQVIQGGGRFTHFEYILWVTIDGIEVMPKVAQGTWHMLCPGDTVLVNFCRYKKNNEIGLSYVVRPVYEDKQVNEAYLTLNELRKVWSKMLGRHEYRQLSTACTISYVFAVAVVNWGLDWNTSLEHWSQIVARFLIYPFLFSLLPLFFLSAFFSADDSRKVRGSEEYKSWQRKVLRAYDLYRTELHDNPGLLQVNIVILAMVLPDDEQKRVTEVIQAWEMKRQQDQEITKIRELLKAK